MCESSAPWTRTEPPTHTRAHGPASPATESSSLRAQFCCSCWSTTPCSSREAQLYSAAHQGWRRMRRRRAHYTMHTHAGGCARAKVGKRLQHFVTHLLCYLASLLLQRYIRITLFLFYTAILVQPSVNIATLLQYMYSTTLHGRWEAAGVWGAALKTRSPLTLVHCSTNHQS